MIARHRRHRTNPIPAMSALSAIFKGENIMYTGTIIEDLIQSVKRAEDHAREQEFRLEFYDYPVLRSQLQELTEVA